MTTPSTSSLLSVRDLSVSFSVPGRRVQAVSGVSFDIGRGETLGIVGESGSGKSVVAYSIVGLIARNGRIDEGSVHFEGRDLRHDRQALHDVRGRRISFIFQNPRAALNPIRSIGQQVCDVVRATSARRPAASDARRKAIELLDLVRIDRAAERYDAFPHQLSGGMCQRILIAMALAADPALIIADEPTTGLDATTQRVIMDTLSDLARDRGLAIMLITHDLGLAARYCGRLAVMKSGSLVEQGPAERVLHAPKRDYTRRLVAATPRLGGALIDLLPEEERAPFRVREEKSANGLGQSLLQADSLSKVFAASGHGIGYRIGRVLARLRGGDVQASPATGIHAVRDVSIRLGRGEALGIVGESGSGKTTASRMLARLIDPSGGLIMLDEHSIGDMPATSFATSPLRRRIQVVFQDPLGSLNPRFTAYEAIRNPLVCCHAGSLPAAVIDERIRQAALRAGLDLALLSRLPHQLSGGQQARVGIARALVVEPDVLILDEPTSALDVSVQAVVLNQLAKLRRELGLAFIFVSHDLNVVRLLCDRVIVMRSGRIVEAGSAEEVLSSPRDPYTRELVDAIPHLPDFSNHFSPTVPA